jgi:predicted CXXCH cytochrome family protein
MLVTRVFDIGPSGTRFEPEATLTLRYDIPHELAPSASNGSAQVATRFCDPASASWIAPRGGSVERANSRTVTARISHLSVWAAADITIPHGGYSYETKLCEVCHDWHGSPSETDILSQPTELDVCYMCHGTGGTVEPNIETEFGDGMRVSFHPVPTPAAAGTQLVCSDCHAEHQSPAEDVGLLYLALGPDRPLLPPEDPIRNDFCTAAIGQCGVRIGVTTIDPRTRRRWRCRVPQPHAADPHLEGGRGRPVPRVPSSAARPRCGRRVHRGVDDYGSTVHLPPPRRDRRPGRRTRVVECASCHNTHLPGTSLVVDPTDTTTLWTGTTSEFCLTCHQEQPPDDPVIASGAKVPYAVRMVADGHDLFSASQWPSAFTASRPRSGLPRHGSSNAYMLTETGGLTGFTDTDADWTNLQSLCVTCHEDKAPSEWHSSVDPSGKACTSCHYHTSPRF